MKFLLLILSVISIGANATQIVVEAKVTGIENTSHGTNEFVVWTTGGSGVCANRHVRFYRSKADASAGNNADGAELHKRAYSMALTAFSTGDKVNIGAIGGTTCDDAVWFKIHK